MTVLTLLTALRHRSATRAALKDRDESSLQPILKWLSKYITDPRYLNTAVEVSLLVIELYSAQLGQAPEVDDLFKRLHTRVKAEAEKAQLACQTGGMLDMLIADSY
jgi:U3 small nucleolar RNA-associated protein 15